MEDPPRKHPLKLQRPTEEAKETTKGSGSTCLKAESFEPSTIILPPVVTNFLCNHAEGTLRTLIDTCSRITFISYSFVRRHRLSTYAAPYPTALAVSGIKTLAVKQCSIELQSRLSKFAIKMVVNVITSSALAYSIRNVDIFTISNVLCSFELADPAFTKPVVDIPHVDLLLGAEYIPAILMGEVKKIDSFTSTPIEILPMETSCLLAIQDIDDRLRQFWESEEIPDISEPKEITEHEACRQHFEKTYTRLANGQFQVQLPFKEPREALTENRMRTLAYQHRFEGNMVEPKLGCLCEDTDG